MNRFIVSSMVLALVMVTHAQANLVVNGDFETGPHQNGYGPITGWTQVIPTVPGPGPGGYITGDALGTPYTLWGNGDPGGTSSGGVGYVGYMELYSPIGVTQTAMEQTLTGLVNGQTYNLSFVENARMSYTGFTVDTLDASVLIDGVTVVAPHDVTAVAALNDYSIPFYSVTVPFTATGTTADLRFVATLTSGSKASYLFDNVSVTPLIPEPASLAMLGLGGMLLLSRRRR